MLKYIEFLLQFRDVLEQKERNSIDAEMKPILQKHKHEFVMQSIREACTKNLWINDKVEKSFRGSAEQLEKILHVLCYYYK